MLLIFFCVLKKSYTTLLISLKAKGKFSDYKKLLINSPPTHYNDPSFSLDAFYQLHEMELQAQLSLSVEEKSLLFSHLPSLSTFEALSTEDKLIFIPLYFAWCQEPYPHNPSFEQQLTALLPNFSSFPPFLQNKLIKYLLPCQQEALALYPNKDLDHDTKNQLITFQVHHIDSLAPERAKQLYPMLCQLPLPYSSSLDDRLIALNYQWAHTLIDIEGQKEKGYLILKKLADLPESYHQHWIIHAQFQLAQYYQKLGGKEVEALSYYSFSVKRAENKVFSEKEHYLFISYYQMASLKKALGYEERQWLNDYHYLVKQAAPKGSSEELRLYVEAMEEYILGQWLLRNRQEALEHYRRLLKLQNLETQFPILYCLSWVRKAHLCQELAEAKPREKAYLEEGATALRHFFSSPSSKRIEQLFPNSIPEELLLAYYDYACLCYESGDIPRSTHILGELIVFSQKYNPSLLEKSQVFAAKLYMKDHPNHPKNLSKARDLLMALMPENGALSPLQSEGQYLLAQSLYLMADEHRSNDLKSQALDIYRKGVKGAYMPWNMLCQYNTAKLIEKKRYFPSPLLLYKSQ